MIGRTNIRQRLRNNDVVISAMLRFPSPAAMEIMALAGVDLVIIDNEHYPFDEETMIDLVRAADVRGAQCRAHPHRPDHGLWRGRHPGPLGGLL